MSLSPQDFLAQRVALSKLGGGSTDLANYIANELKARRSIAQPNDSYVTFLQSQSASQQSRDADFANRLSQITREGDQFSSTRQPSEDIKSKLDEKRGNVQFVERYQQKIEIDPETNEPIISEEPVYGSRPETNEEIAARDAFAATQVQNFNSAVGQEGLSRERILMREENLRRDRLNQIEELQRQAKAAAGTSDQALLTSRSEKKKREELARGTAEKSRLLEELAKKNAAAASSVTQAPLLPSVKRRVKSPFDSMALQSNNTGGLSPQSGAATASLQSNVI